MRLLFAEPHCIDGGQRRTRMLGGVGAAVSNGGGNPI